MSNNRHEIKTAFGAVTISEDPSTGELIVDASNATGVQRISTITGVRAGKAPSTENPVLAAPTATAPVEESASETALGTENWQIHESVIRLAEIQFADISPHFKDVDGKAMLLVDPKDLANYGINPAPRQNDDHTNMTFFQPTANTIHAFDDHLGMPPADLKDISAYHYEESLLEHIKQCQDQANSTGKKVLTGWFIPTSRLYIGHNVSKPLDKTLEEAYPMPGLRYWPQAITEAGGQPIELKSDARDRTNGFGTVKFTNAYLTCTPHEAQKGTIVHEGGKPTSGIRGNLRMVALELSPDK